jgi:hypothetical protein
MAAARGLAVDGDEIRPIRPDLGNPRSKAGREQAWIDPIQAPHKSSAHLNKTVSITGKVAMVVTFRYLKINNKLTEVIFC